MGTVIIAIVIALVVWNAVRTVGRQKKRPSHDYEPQKGRYLCAGRGVARCGGTACRVPASAPAAAGAGCCALNTKRKLAIIVIKKSGDKRWR